MSPVDHISLDRVPDSLRIVREIHLSEASSILEIELEGHKCAMKLFHDNGDPGVAENGRDLNRFRCELNAYMKLQKHKVYEAGFVPYFYGHIDRVNPSLFQPELRDFTHDKFHPSAIVLEYFPNAEGLNCENYSDVSYRQAIEGMMRIHDAHVHHQDIYPKNGSCGSTLMSRQQFLPWVRKNSDKVNMKMSLLRGMGKRWLVHYDCL